LLGELDGLIESSPSLERFLGQVTPLGRDLATAKGDGIRIMSMAASKGLTVAATIVAGVESDIIPKPKAPSDEERRLLYVAMTRATDHLFVTWSRIRRGPTARAGRGRANSRRHHSRFLDGGSVRSQDGNGYIGKRLITTGGFRRCSFARGSLCLPVTFGFLTRQSQGRALWGVFRRRRSAFQSEFRQIAFGTSGALPGPFSDSFVPHHEFA
jgi:hypothetical protein